MYKFRTLCALAMVVATSMYGGEPEALLGTAILRGTGFVNDKPVIGYAANLGKNDRLKTGAKSGAILTVATGDTIAVGENSSVALTRSPFGTVASFESGNVTVATRQEKLQELRISDGAATVRTSPGRQSRYQVAMVGNTTYVLPSKGSVSIKSPGKVATNVPEGMMGVIGTSGVIQEYNQRSSLALPQQQASQSSSNPQASRAGKLSAVIPADYIVRGSSQSNGNVGDAVLLNDLLKTGTRGRMRFTMDDGSIVTVGSNSQFQVKDQNTQSQQSSVEMMYGKMRAQVSKRTVPGGKFEIRTSTAICGVIGTDLYIDATPTLTRIIVFSGIVRVLPLIAGAAAGFTLTAGQTGVMMLSGATSPIAATASQIQSAVNITQVSEAGVQAAAAGGAVATSTGTNIAVVAATLAPPAIAAGASIPLFTQDEISPTQP